jgi:hypothetical protein
MTQRKPITAEIVLSLIKSGCAGVYVNHPWKIDCEDMAEIQAHILNAMERFCEKKNAPESWKKAWMACRENDEWIVRSVIHVATTDDGKDHIVIDAHTVSGSNGTTYEPFRLWRHVFATSKEAEAFAEERNAAQNTSPPEGGMTP